LAEPEFEAQGDKRVSTTDAAEQWMPVSTVMLANDAALIVTTRTATTNTSGQEETTLRSTPDLGVHTMRRALAVADRQQIIH
jgi:hypothetical protein